MGDPPGGGININPSAPAGSKYSPIVGYENRPVTNVTFYTAVRFANWLNNGQGNGDTELGAYALQGGTPIPVNAASIVRNPSATIFLPSDDEWYKAAYFNPETSTYFKYPTSSNTAPTATAPTKSPNSANYGHVSGATDVGAYTGTHSPAGAFDMGGNVWQWDEGAFGGTSHIVRGGSYQVTNPTSLSALSRISFPSALEAYDFGFRLASVAPISLPGDVNFDGFVNTQDIAQISSNWLGKGFRTAGDANTDGITNAQDIAFISANWLSSSHAGVASVAAVPEPATRLLAILSIGAFLALRRCV